MIFQYLPMGVSNDFSILPCVGDSKSELKTLITIHVSSEIIMIHGYNKPILKPTKCHLNQQSVT